MVLALLSLRLNRSTDGPTLGSRVGPAPSGIPLGAPTTFQVVGTVVDCNALGLSKPRAIQSMTVLTARRAVSALRDISLSALSIDRDLPAPRGRKVQS